MHAEQAALGTTTHLSLGVGLQPEQTAHLQGFSLDDSSPHEVLRVGVHIVQESRAKPQELRGTGGARSLLAPRQQHSSYPKPLGVEISPTLPMGKQVQVEQTPHPKSQSSGEERQDWDGSPRASPV